MSGKHCQLIVSQGRSRRRVGEVLDVLKYANIGVEDSIFARQ